MFLPPGVQCVLQCTTRSNDTSKNLGRVNDIGQEESFKLYFANISFTMKSAFFTKTKEKVIFSLAQHKDLDNSTATYICHSREPNPST